MRYYEKVLESGGMIIGPMAECDACRWRGPLAASHQPQRVQPQSSRLWAKVVLVMLGAAAALGLAVLVARPLYAAYSRKKAIYREMVDADLTALQRAKSLEEYKLSLSGRLRVLVAKHGLTVKRASEVYSDGICKDWETAGQKASYREPHPDYDFGPREVFDNMIREKYVPSQLVNQLTQAERAAIYRELAETQIKTYYGVPDP
jgi:hypothetical protein